MVQVSERINISGPCIDYNLLRLASCMAAEEDTIYVQPFEAELPTAANIGTSHDRALGSFQLPVSMEKKMLTTGCAHTGYHMKYCAFIRPAQNSANICEMSARKKEHSCDTYKLHLCPTAVGRQTLCCLYLLLPQDFYCTACVKKGGTPLVFCLKFALRVGKNNW